MFLGDCNQRDAALALNERTVALLPLGAVEVHGNHLPLLTDLYLAEGVCKLVCERVQNCVVLPSMPYGQIWSLRDQPGSLSVSNEVLTAMLSDIGRSLWRHGVKRFAIVNGHVGNAVAIKAAQRVLYDECELKVYAFTYPGAGPAQKQVLTTPRPHPVYFHACEIETSYMLYLRPDKVDMSQAIRQYPELPDTLEVLPTPWSDFMQTAVLGDATAATPEKGETIIHAVVDTIVRLMGEE